MSFLSPSMGLAYLSSNPDKLGPVLELQRNLFETCPSRRAQELK